MRDSTNGIPADRASAGGTLELSAGHLARLRDRHGLTDDTIRRCRFSTETRASVVGKRLNWKYPARHLGPCLAIPYLAVDGTPTGHVRFRPDTPRKRNGKPVKYESPVGSENRAYFPPGVGAAVADPAARLLITEGELKAAKATQEGRPTVAVAGVFNGQKRHEDGKPRELIDDLAAIPWAGRPVVIVFDSDIAANRQVQLAEYQLAQLLAARGAVVKVARLPPGPAGGDGEPAKVGLDDYLLTHPAADLDGLIAAAADPKEPEPPKPDYFVRAGCMWHRQTKVVKDGVVEVQQRLCNFVARIREEQVVDGGAAAPDRRFVIAGRHEDGGGLDPVVVPAGDFAGMGWVSELWGARPIICAGREKKDHTRAAIQELSKEVARRVVHRHTGWAEVNGAAVYLHAGGGVGAGGAVPDVAVELDGPAAGFRLPDPPQGAALTAAVRAALRVWSLGPTAVVAPVLGAVFRAPLGASDFGVHLAGKSGLGKSELLALGQQFYGAGMDRLHLPGSWSSTENSLESLAHQLKDAVFAVDDFKPTGHRHLDDALNEKADRLFRGQGNQSGRGRCGPDGGLLPPRPPRGIVLSSGEESPRGESLAARVWQVPIEPGDLDVRRLTPYQRDAAAGHYAACTSGYVRWLAAGMPDLHRRVADEFATLRDDLAGRLTGAHARTSGVVANLLLGLGYFLRFATGCGAVTAADRDRMLAAARDALTEAAADQAAAAAARSPERRFVDLVAALLESGRCYFQGETGGVPSCAHRWGWRDGADGTFVPAQSTSVCVGWIVGEDVYLSPAVAYAEARKLSEQQGDPLPVSEHQLRKRLDAAGLLASKETGKLTQRRVLNGASRSVLHLRVTSLYPSHPPGWTGDGDPGDAWEPDPDRPPPESTSDTGEAA